MKSSTTPLWRNPLVLGVTALMALALPYVLTPYYLGLVVKMLIFALFAMSLDLLIGYTGMASLGHAAYFGLSAYATGLLALKLGWNVWFALPAGLLASALAATLFGLLALRTRGSYFLMITLALSQLMWGIAFGWRSLTGGDDGLPDVPRPRLGGGVSLADGVSFYFFVLLLVGLSSWILYRIVSSPFGYCLRGIRESELKSPSPHNTYFIPGLPPTAICNPGRASLAAVMAPPPGEEIFFVADGTGGHAFASTLEEHNRNVARWRQLESPDAKKPEQPAEKSAEISKGKAR